MKRLSLFLCLTYFLSTPLFGQVGNEWIQFGQSYFKIPVAREGMYRLSYAQLQQAGFPVPGDPRRIQLFHRGIEQSIQVVGEDDGVLHPSDYIEFFGRGNDGTLDKDLYVSPQAQPHSLYNLFSDTTAYFLTLGANNGKRMAQHASSVGTPATFHWDEKLLVNRDQYSAGVDYGDVLLTAFDIGEGWTGNQILQTQTLPYVIEGITNTSTTSGVPQLEVLMTGRGRMNHIVELYAGARLLNTIQFNGYNSFLYSTPLVWSDVTADGKITIQVRVIGANGSPDRISVGYVRLRYPQLVNMMGASEKLFLLSADAGSSRTMNITNAPASLRVFDVTNPADVRRVTGNPLTLPASSTTTRIFATSTFITPTIRRVSFRVINPAQPDYVVITHQKLRRPASGYVDPVKAYAEYRSLPAGGSYDTMVVNISQLYDQFSYGEQTPLAIYRFCKHLLTVPRDRHLFIIGKGLDVYYNFQRQPQAFSSYQSLVPTAGYPASDMMFSAVGGPIPRMSTGRLSANVPQDVAAYFNKVKELESLPFNDLRRKNILHLSGGIYEGEPQRFRGHLQSYARIAEGPLLGAKVTAIGKQTREVEVVNVAEEINAGVGLVTFFGHSASTSTDFDIGRVTDAVMGYNNTGGRYPVLLMNGCYAGSFFLNTSIFGENWALTPQRGAIGVIAHSYLAYEGPLYLYSQLFYSVGFSDPVFAGRGLGDIQREIAKRYISTYGESERNVTQIHQMVLLGDPAVSMFPAEKPDYVVDESSLKVTSADGSLLTALSDSLLVSFRLKNFGLAPNVQYRISVARTLADGNVLSYDSSIKATSYEDTVVFKLPGRVPNGFSSNTFEVSIDADGEIDELREDNNNASVEIFIPSSGTQHLFPQNFAILNSTEVSLSFQHSDLLSGKRDFVLQIDTVANFNSLAKLEFTLNDQKVIASKKVQLFDKDSVTYYWRTRLGDPKEDESTEWETSSFTYIKNGSEGWGQLQFNQYMANSRDFLVLDEQARKMEFPETVSSISLKTFSTQFGYPRDSVSVKINGAEYNLVIQEDLILSCRDNTINLIAFDRSTTQPYAGVFIPWIQFSQLGNRPIICGRDPVVINSYRPDELLMANDFNIIKYVDNVAVGDSVILFSIGNAGYAQWPAAAITKLGELGISAAQISTLQNGDPVVIFGRKGSAPGSARVLSTTNLPAAEKKIMVSQTVTGRAKQGSMKSPRIGPALSWSEFSYGVRKETSDVIQFDIIGIKTNGDEVVIEDSVKSNYDLSALNAAEYPYLQLAYHAQDQTLITAPQLRQWVVTFEAAPEGVVLYKGEQGPVQKQEGQVYAADYQFVNISNKNFGQPLRVDYRITNTTSTASRSGQLVINAPAPGDTSRFTIQYPTVGQDGWNSLELTANAVPLPETTFSNNSIALNRFLEVLTDSEPPVLDVTFDGRHIEAGSFVSPSPSIAIKLWDNNPYLFRTDTLGMIILLSSPCDEIEDCPFKRIYFSNSTDLTWEAENEAQEFNAKFNPKGLPDGLYVLRVIAEDVNGNRPGQPYEISFRVKNEGSVLQPSVYPNPFSYRANFEFTLTGDKIPDSFTLEIVSLTGRLVHRFVNPGNVQFNIGRNIIPWTAIDTQGIPLPPGIYFYKMAVGVGDKQFRFEGKVVLQR